MSFDSITVARAAAILNGSIVIIQHSLAIGVASMLVCHMYSVNSAASWSSLTRRIHWTLWPDLLRSDSASSADLRSPLKIIGWLGILGGILVAIANITTPLGLSDGPPVRSKYKNMTTNYIADKSFTGLATQPRYAHRYSQICGIYRTRLVTCPGHQGPYDYTIPPSTLNIFNSTPFGPFNMQFRHYTQQSGYTYGYRAIVESQILRDDIFAIEGLIVDLTSTPGIGFWNHTLPTLRRGGVWSQEILWLEPVTACVNTNLTIDYQLYSPDSGPISVQYNLTDRGGFANLPFDKPELNSTGQNVDVYAHADYGAFITNNLTMYSLGATRNTSYVGKTFPIEAFRFVPIFAGRLQFLHPGMIVNISTEELYEAAGLLTNRCQGYGAFSTAGINTVGVHCILILGPPTRLDGEDPRLPDKTTIWTQNLTLCASTVRMRMQNVTFSFNGTMELSSLHISRKNTGAPVLWGVQKTMLPIVDIDLLWGRVADAYEEDQSIWTHRYEYLYLPARYSNIWAYTGIGNPSSMALAIWQALRIQFLGGHDYSGAKKYSLLAKWQSLIGSDPINGPSNMLNRVWTDLAANNLMGSHTTRNISAASYGPSTSYDPNYGVAFILLVSIWLPTLLIASFLLLSGRLKLSHIRHLLNETSIGRAAVGDSVLVPSEDDREREPVATDDTEAHPSSSQEQGESSADKDIEARLKTSVWMKTRGETLVAFGPIRSAFGDGNGEGGDPPNTDTIELENPQSDFTVRKEKLRAYLRELVKLERNGGA